MTGPNMNFHYWILLFNPCAKQLWQVQICFGPVEGQDIRLKLWKMAFAFYNFVSVVCINQVRTFYWKHVTFWQGREHSSREVHTVADCVKFCPKNMNLCIYISKHSLYNVILRIARNLLETRENIKIKSHPFYHIL